MDSIVKKEYEVIVQNLNIKLAEEKDSADVYAWRNDPKTRAMSKNTKLVTIDEHNNWYNKAINSQDCLMLIARLDIKDKIGMCRFNINTDQKFAEVSINLNPKYRGNKLSYPLLRGAIQYFSKIHIFELRAVIRKENFASIKCFVSCGFSLYEEHEDFYCYKMDP